MDINKIKNYNQKILALAGTLLVALLIVLLISAITVFFDEIVDFGGDYPNHDIVAEDVAQQNIEQNIRTHQISFENLQLIDSAKGYYLIPISQTHLELKEYVNSRSEKVSANLDLYSGGGSFEDYYYSSANFNNILFYNSFTKEIIKLFDKRVSITEIEFDTISNQRYVFFTVTKGDSNKDGVLNELDYKSLFYMTLNDLKMHEIASVNWDYIHYVPLRISKQLIIRYGVDKNKDGIYNWDEPMIMKLYNLKSKEMTDLIDPKLIDELQNQLDGK